MNTTRNRLVRAAVAAPLAAALLLGTAACSSGEDVGVTDDEFGQLESDYAELEERVGVLEEEAGV
jgi:hypothetical protein